MRSKREKTTTPSKAQSIVFDERSSIGIVETTYHSLFVFTIVNALKVFCPFEFIISKVPDVCLRVFFKSI